MLSKIFKCSSKAAISLMFSLVIATLIPFFTASSLAVSGQNIASLTNAERDAAGIASLSWSGALASFAYAKLNHMCTNNYWAHTAPDGTSPWTFVSAAGYRYTHVAENLARSFSSDNAVISGWMNSPGHRANILNGAYKDIGVASKQCTIMGKSSTVVVAHYGATSASPKTETSMQQQKLSRKPQVKSVSDNKPVNKIKPINKPTLAAKITEKPKSKKSSEDLPTIKSETSVDKLNLVTTLLQMSQLKQNKLLVVLQRFDV